MNFKIVRHMLPNDNIYRPNFKGCMALKINKRIEVKAVL